MPEVNDTVRPKTDTTSLDAAAMIEAAQKAAASGDYVAAERLLRDAAALQEATLGSVHPDLASTLNNLAFVCERTNKIDEAERGYRRAHSIAVKSLAPRHPFVATSLKNLVDFCAAHDIPIWTPPDAEPEEEPPPLDDEPVVTNKPWLRIAAFATVAVAVIVIASFAVPRRSASVAPVPAVTTEPPVTVPESRDVTPPTVAETPTVPEPKKTPAPRETREASRTSASGPVTVLNAQLCSALEKSGSPDWQCTPVSGVMRPGRYVFYTRLLTTADTTVEHRWFHDGRVHQVMRLRVSPGPGNGYRTYSSNRVIAERAGEWKVELRSRDGALLHEERLVVR